MLESRSMKKILAIIVLNLFLISNGFADLKGILEMQLFIEPLKAKAKICGVKRENLETSARYILSNSKIKLVKSHPISIYINSNIGENEGCYANTSIDVYKIMKDPGSNNWGRFYYYSDGGIASGGKGADFGDPYISSFEQLLKKLVVEHSNDN